MWQQIADFLKAAFTVNQSLARHESDIKKLRDDLDKVSDRLEKLIIQMKASQRAERLEREKFILEVKLHQSEFRKRLPPPTN